MPDLNIYLINDGEDIVSIFDLKRFNSCTFAEKGLILVHLLKKV